MLKKKQTLILVGLLLFALTSFVAGYYLQELVMWDKKSNSINEENSAQSGLTIEKLNANDILDETNISNNKDDAKINYTFDKRLTEITPNEQPLKTKTKNEPLLATPPLPKNNKAVAKATKTSSNLPAKTFVDQKGNPDLVSESDGIHKTQPDVKSEYSIQIGSYLSKRDAEATAKKFRSKGYLTYVTKFKKGSRDYYRVRIGIFKTKATAEKVRVGLKKNEGINSILIVQ
ncbi:MAG: SPOR domain-containing protein [Nitrospinota bacterium]